MYQFELNLDRATAATKSLQLTEEICDQFRLHNNSGTIIFAIDVLIEKMLEELPGEFNAKLVADIEKNGVSFTLHTEQPLLALKAGIEQATLLNDDSNCFIISNLADFVEFRNNDREVYLEFCAKPKMISDFNERTDILQHATLVQKKYVIN